MGTVSLVPSAVASGHVLAVLSYISPQSHLSNAESGDKVEGPNTYILLLTGKPEQQQWCTHQH